MTDGAGVNAGGSSSTPSERSMRVHMIVVGVDGSVPSRAAIRWAVTEAAFAGVPLVLAHVVDDEGGIVGSRIVTEIGDDAPKLLEREREYARGIESTARIETTIETGSPMWELAQLSAEDVLLVAGTHKSGFHYGRAFGSRSLQLANLARGPVAVIPESVTRLRSGVVAGVDPTPAGMRALDLAAEHAVAHDAELTLVRAAGPALAERDLGERSAGERRDRLSSDDDARRMLADAVQRVHSRCPRLVTRSRLVRRPAGAALNEQARNAELLVIGDSRRPGHQPGMLGSVAYDVLLNLTSPTIVVHAPRDLRPCSDPPSDG